MKELQVLEDRAQALSRKLCADDRHAPSLYRQTIPSLKQQLEEVRKKTDRIGAMIAGFDKLESFCEMCDDLFSHLLTLADIFDCVIYQQIKRTHRF